MELLDLETQVGIPPTMMKATMVTVAKIITLVGPTYIEALQRRKLELQQITTEVMTPASEEL